MRHVTANLYKSHLGMLERAVSAESFGYETRPIEIIGTAWSWMDQKTRMGLKPERQDIKPGNIVTIAHDDDADRLLVTAVLSPTKDPRHPEAITLHSGLLSEFARDAETHERRQVLDSGPVPPGWFYCLSAENVGTTDISNTGIRLRTEAPEWIGHCGGRTAGLSFGSVELAPGEMRSLRLTAPANLSLRRLVIGSNRSVRPDGIMVTRATWGDKTLLEDTAAGLFAANSETGSFSQYLTLPYEAVELLKKQGRWDALRSHGVDFPWDTIQVVKQGYHAPVPTLTQGKSAELTLRNDYAKRTVTVHAVAMVDMDERWEEAK